jgi:hypothetical protein
MKKYLDLIFILVICSVIFPFTAHAYLDPGTGSLLIQLIIASFVGASFAIKVWWGKIKFFFVSLFSKKGEDKDSNLPEK